jgi:hypothetical protein
MSTLLNDNGIPHLFDPLLIPASADHGIKDHETDSIIVRELATRNNRI